jgi:Domain of unknown function (DUF6379)
MFEKYMIVPEMAKNTETGFQFGARLPYYRGISLSMVEEIVVTVDGVILPQNVVDITVHGNKYNLEKRENETTDRWEMGEIAVLTVKKDGGLSNGEHKIQLMLNLRIAYLPFPAIRVSEKTLTI